jgi:putative ABC transport system permease protein
MPEPDMASRSQPFPTSDPQTAAGQPLRLNASRSTAELVLYDAFHDWRVTICMILGLVAVMVPLLVLFGVKFGVVNTLTERLLEDPRNREIVPVGSGRFGSEWFETMAQRPDVVFVIPKTRAIAATMRLRNPELRRARPISSDLIPSAAGDPLLEGLNALPKGFETVVFSEPAARKIDVAKGDVVEGILQRTRHGQSERVILQLEVAEVLPYAALGRDAAFVSLELLEATEAYRDGIAVDSQRWSGDQRASLDRSFASFRLYARSIDDVVQLRNDLVDQGIEVRTQATAIENLQSLDRNLSKVFWIIAAIGTIGFLFSLSASLWASVDRKRRELSVLLLLGFPSRSVILFPVLSSMLIGLAGAFVALVVYFFVQAGINSLFNPNLEPGETVALLMPSHAAVAVMTTLAVALIASSLAGLKAAKVEPAEGIRDA